MPLTGAIAAAQVEAVYRRESRRVLATLIRLLGDFDRAEEALQDAFAAALMVKAGFGTAPQKALLARLGRLTGSTGFNGFRGAAQDPAARVAGIVFAAAVLVGLVAPWLAATGERHPPDLPDLLGELGDDGALVDVEPGDELAVRLDADLDHAVAAELHRLAGGRHEVRAEPGGRHVGDLGAPGDGGGAEGRHAVRQRRVREVEQEAAVADLVGVHHVRGDVAVQHHAPLGHLAEGDAVLAHRGVVRVDLLEAGEDLVPALAGRALGGLSHGPIVSQVAPPRA